MNGDLKNMNLYKTDIFWIITLVFYCKSVFYKENRLGESGIPAPIEACPFIQ